MQDTTIHLQSFDDLLPHVGQHLTTTGWRVMEQERINRFALATDDHQWIHLDEARARAESPYGATIAHGFLTLSMLAEFLQSSVHCQAAKRGINYGLNKVRFPAPVLAGDQIRAHVSVVSLERLPDQDAVQITWGVTIEAQGQDKPACVAEMITRWYA